MISRLEWPPGPWHDEPDEERFEHAGFACLLARGPMGHWCGYVIIPEGHALHGKDCFADEYPYFEVHGGINFAGAHMLEPRWCVGFDCNHLHDRPPDDNFPEDDDDAVYRTIDYARRETKLLADQVANMDQRPARSDVPVTERLLSCLFTRETP